MFLITENSYYALFWILRLLHTRCHFCNVLYNLKMQITENILMLMQLANGLILMVRRVHISFCKTVTWTEIKNITKNMYRQTC